MAAMGAAMTKKKEQPQHTHKACVYIERGGTSIRIDDVPTEDCIEVLADLLEGFRQLREVYDEVSDISPTVGGYSPVEVTDDDWAEEDGIGFRPPGRIH